MDFLRCLCFPIFFHTFRRITVRGPRGGEGRSNVSSRGPELAGGRALCGRARLPEHLSDCEVAQVARAGMRGLGRGRRKCGGNGARGRARARVQPHREPVAAAATIHRRALCRRWRRAVTLATGGAMVAAAAAVAAARGGGGGRVPNVSVRFRAARGPLPPACVRPRSRGAAGIGAVPRRRRHPAAARRGGRTQAHRGTEDAAAPFGAPPRSTAVGVPAAAAAVRVFDRAAGRAGRVRERRPGEYDDGPERLHFRPHRRRAVQPARVRQSPEHN